MGIKVLDRLFGMRIPLSQSCDDCGMRLTIDAFDCAQFDPETGRPVAGPHHHAITFRAVLTRPGGVREVVWEPGDGWVGIPGQHSVDGAYARDAVLSWFGMRPGNGIDREVFAQWTPAQLALAECHADEIDMVREDRAGRWVVGSRHGGR